MSSAQCDGELVTIYIKLRRRRKKEVKKIDICIPPKLEYPCDILIKHRDVLPKKLIVLKGCSKGTISASLAKTYERLRKKLCNTQNSKDQPKTQALTLRDLVKNTNNYRIAEFIIYALAKEGILNIEYWGPIGRRNSPPEHKKAWRGVSSIPRNRRDAALKLLWYLVTTRSETMRQRRAKAWRPNIIIWPRKTDKLCTQKHNTKTTN